MLAVAEQLRALRLSVSTVFNITADHAWAVDDAICRAPGRVLPLNGGYCCGPKGARPPPSALWLPACSLRAAGPCQIFDRRECFRAGATIFKAALPNATYRPPLPTVAAGGCCGSNAGTELPNAGKGWSPPVTNVGFDLTGLGMGKGREGPCRAQVPWQCSRTSIRPQRGRDTLCAVRRLNAAAHLRRQRRPDRQALAALGWRCEPAGAVRREEPASVQPGTPPARRRRTCSHAFWQAPPANGERRRRTERRKERRI